MPKQKVQVWIYFRSPTRRSYLFLVLKTRPGRGEFWQPVTGGVEPKESVDAAALREAQEETGLSFAGLPHFLGISFEFESRGDQVRESGYALEAVVPSSESTPSELFSAQDPPAVKLDPHEHTEFRWVGAEDARKMIAYPSNVQVLNSLLDHIQSQEGGA